MRSSCRPRRPRGTSTSAGSTVVDPSESDRFSFEEVRRTLLERIPRVPKFRWKLKEVPLHLDRAVWIEDEHFDVDKHLRRIAVPPPGGRREVGDLMGMFMGYQLDRRRPLWEMFYVDGVVGGQVALITKFHHCLMDGASGAGLAEQLFDLEPDPPPVAEVPPPADGCRALRAVRPRARRPRVDPHRADAAEDPRVPPPHGGTRGDDPPAAQREPDGARGGRTVLQRDRRPAPPELVHLGEPR